MDPFLIFLAVKFIWTFACGVQQPTEPTASSTPSPASMWDPELWPAYPDRMYLLFRRAFLDVANSDAKIAYYFHTINRPTVWYAPAYHNATPDPHAEMPNQMHRFEGFEKLFNIVKEAYEIRKKRYEDHLAKMASTTTDQYPEATTDATSIEPTTTVDQDFDVYVTSEGDADYISLLASTENPAEVYVVNKDIGSTEKTVVHDITENRAVYVLKDDSSTEKSDEVYVVDDDSNTGNADEVYVMDVEVQNNKGHRTLTKRAGILVEEPTTTTMVPETTSDSPDDVTPLYVSIPVTSFTCKDKKYIPGFYADLETGCRIFHICRDKGIKDSYACPDGTTFDQATLSCAFNVNCLQTPAYYDMNAAVEHEAKRPSSKMADRLLQDILVAAIENVAADSYKVLE